MTFLDVFPLAHGGGRLAMGSKMAAGEAAAKSILPEAIAKGRALQTKGASKVEISKAFEPVEAAYREAAGIPKLSPQEALAQGNPLKALVRKASGNVTTELGVTLPRSSYLTQRIAKQIGTSAEARWAARQFSQQTRRSNQQALDFINSETGKVLAALTPEERVDIWNKFSTAKADPFTGELVDHLGRSFTEREQVLLNHTRTMNDMYEAVGLRDRARKVGVKGGEVTIEHGPDMYRIPGEDGTTHMYSIDSKAARAHIAMNNAAAKLDERIAKFEQRTNDIAEWMDANPAPRNLDQAKALKKLDNKAKRAEKAAVAARNRYKASRRQFTESFLLDPEARYHPLIIPRIREAAQEYVGREYGTMLADDDPIYDAVREAHREGGLQAIRDRVSDSTSINDLKTVLGPRFQPMLDDAIASWQDLAKQGYDPIYMSAVDIDDFKFSLQTNPRASGLDRPGHTRPKEINLGPQRKDFYVSITKPMLNNIRSKATESLHLDHILPQFGVLKSKLVQDVKRSLREQGKYLDLDTNAFDTKVEQIIRDSYDTYHPNTYNVGGKVRVGAKDELLLPKDVARTLERLHSRGNLEVTGPWNKLMNTYKAFVLTGPRHIAHIALGNIMFMGLRQPEALPQLFKVKRAIPKELVDEYGFAGALERWLPDELSKEVNWHESDKALQIMSGKTQGRLLKEYWGKTGGNLARRANDFEKNISNLYKAASLLSSAKKGLDIEEGVNLAHKVFIDMDDFTPFERTVIRNIFPFAGFTKHLLKYVLSYPIDHPVRAAILTRLAGQAQEDWDTGLPKVFQNLFYFGTPDVAGDQWAVEGKTFNPFRSLGDIWSLTGFISSMNPAVGATLESVGVNPLSGSGELYPETYVDEETGTVKARRPDNPALNYLHAFIPEVKALELVFGKSDRIRKFKQDNPTGYLKQLGSSLNLVFIPHKVNPAEARAKAEINRIEQARREVSTGIKTGDWSRALQYNLVPYQGQYIDPRLLQSFIERIRAAIGGQVSPTAVIPQIAPGYRAPKSESGR